MIKENSEILFNLDYYQEQVYFVLYLTNGKKQRQIAEFFGVCPGTIYQHNLRRCSDKQNVGAPRCLNNEQLIAVSIFIQEKYNEKNYLANIYENGTFSSRQGSERSTRDILPELDIYFSKQIAPQQDLSINLVGGYVSSDLDYWYEEEEMDRYFTSFSADGSRYNLIGELKYNDRFSKNHSLSIGIKESHFWEEDRYSNESGVRETDNNYLYAYAQLAGNFNKFI